MEALTAILNSPLPVAVTSIIALASLLGYWFFVIPLLEEAKTLRERNAKLQGALLEEIKNHAVSLKVTLDGISESVLDKQNFNELASVISELRLTVERHGDLLQTSVASILQGVRASVEILTRNIADGAADGAHSGDNIRREIDRLGRLLETLSRQLSEVGDRQSQVTGILTGMSIAQRPNKSL